ncbi:MAG: hypothetical protein AB9866_04085 [Syntrophobacteraceae bacterium]
MLKLRLGNQQISEPSLRPITLRTSILVVENSDAKNVAAVSAHIIIGRNRYYPVSEILNQIRKLVGQDLVLISSHGYDELADDGMRCET